MDPIKPAPTGPPAPDVARSWDERYALDGLAYGAQPNEFLRGQEERLRAGGQRTLTLGEGEGRNAIWLAQLGLDVTAVDLSAVGLSKAAAWAGRLGLVVRTIQADLGEFAIEPERWDVAVSIFCHLPPAVRERLYARVVRGLAPGGLLVLEAYAPSQIARGTGGPPDVRFMASEAELREQLAGLEFLESRTISREVVEGRYHTGLADVVQIVGRKG